MWLWLWLVEPGSSIASSIARALLSRRFSSATSASSVSPFFIGFPGFFQFLSNALVVPPFREKLGKSVAHVTPLLWRCSSNASKSFVVVWERAFGPIMHNQQEICPMLDRRQVLSIG